MTRSPGVNPPRSRAAESSALADGEWHRLHPATPLLRGGIGLVAVLGVVLVNLRDVLIQLVLGGRDFGGDPVVWVIDHGYAAAALGLFALGLALFIAGFYLSWRMHTFRVTDELVEVRSGILFRTHRRARLDRIQGVNLARPFLARLFGVAKLEVIVAGHDASVPLAYLGSAAADELRRAVLLLASGASATASVAVSTPAGGVIERRMAELLAPELDPDAAPPQSVVQMHLGRLVGSILLSGFTVFILLVAAGVLVLMTVSSQYLFLFGLVPTAIGLAGYYLSKFTRSLRYSIASTPDGIRVGFGLLSTSNETLPPGRIHAVEVAQPLLWRPAGWWAITINRASSAANGAERQVQTTILPVGNLADVRKVIGLIFPGALDASLLEHGLTSRGGNDGFVNSPWRAIVLRLLSWRRNGFAVTENTVLLRTGVIRRELVIVPLARMQSVALHQGPLSRRLGLASVSLHTVAGPIRPHLGAIDATEAVRLFEGVAVAAVRSAGADTSHRWRSDELPV